MDSATVKGLGDKLYDKRKQTALDLERSIHTLELSRVSQIIDQLLAMFSPTLPFFTRSGGLIGLAGVCIALNEELNQFLDRIVPPVLACLYDPDSRVRYHACESMYNIAKVGRSETLAYFTEIFDCLSKLAADPEQSVKNGAELLDRLMKDIITEGPATYSASLAGGGNLNLPASTDVPSGKLAKMTLASDKDAKSVNGSGNGNDTQGAADKGAIVSGDRKAFSLTQFIPLVSERVYVISPHTRMHLVQWLSTLDTVPDLELVAWLPEFLDGIMKYLADPSVDVRLSTENLLSEFLREIRYIASVQEKQAQMERRKRENRGSSRPPREKNKSTGEEGETAVGSDVEDDEDNNEEEWEGEGSGAWVPGQGVHINHAAIMEIIIQHLSYPDELVQSTAMEWILVFLELAQNTVISFTPRIVPAILPNLASPSRQIKMAAHETNGSLYRVIQSLPLQIHPTPSPVSQTSQTASSSNGGPDTSLAMTSGSPPTQAVQTGSPATATTGSRKEASQTESSATDPLSSNGPPVSAAVGSSSSSKPLATSSSASNVGSLRIKPPSSVPTSEPVTPVNFEFPAGVKSSANKADSPVTPANNSTDTGTLRSPIAVNETHVDEDVFDVKETVNVLTLQFLSDHAETRIAALEWLLMLHLKAPQKIISRDSSTFPALLKTLSDPSEDVVKHDLQLLAQISASSEEAYFTSFMVNVLELFSTDRRLLETRGSLIIRQLCLHLNAERIFRTIAEILEKDDDLEFASMMVIKLNMILITSPELADFRRRLKNLETKDGQMLFSSLYRSWCHNPVAVFALCLLAQAYEHASNLLQIFADLELTVSLLVQMDKLVMLIESPVFLNLRLQLLEPEKYPYLPKCLYGLLMILPQSSAFVSLRARLMAVHSGGYIPTQAKASTFANAAGTTRSKLGGKDEIKWQELLSHFRAVQTRHEKTRRRHAEGDFGSISSAHYSSPSQTHMSAGAGGSTAGPGGSAGAAAGKTVRRKIGSGSTSRERQSSMDGGKSGLSPMNPRRHHPSGGSGSGLMSPGVSIGGAVASMNSSAGLGTIRPGSPPSSGLAARRRLLGGMRKGGAGQSS